MTEWRLSERASQDFRDLYVYGAETFGRNAALAYADSLYECFERIALNPRMERPASVGDGVRRFEHRKHVVYYDVEPVGVRVLGIVHQRSVRGIEA